MTDFILSIGAVTATGATFKRYIHPPRDWLGRRKKVGAGASAVNGYTPELWDRLGAVEDVQAAHSFALWLKSVKKEGARRPLAQRTGIVRPGPASLDHLARISAQERPTVHDALADAKVCLHGYATLIEIAKKERTAML